MMTATLGEGPISDPHQLRGSCLTVWSGGWIRNLIPSDANNTSNFPATEPLLALYNFDVFSCILQSLVTDAEIEAQGIKGFVEGGSSA